MNTPHDDANTLINMGFQFDSFTARDKSARIKRGTEIMWVPSGIGAVMKSIGERQRRTEYLETNLANLIQDRNDGTLWRNRRSRELYHITDICRAFTSLEQSVVHFQHRFGPHHGRGQLPLSEFLDQHYWTNAKHGTPPGCRGHGMVFDPSIIWFDEKPCNFPPAPPVSVSIDSIAKTLGTETEEQKRRRNAEMRHFIRMECEALRARLVKELANG